MYQEQAQLVADAITALEQDGRSDFLARLDQAQLAGSTSLEIYGITAGVFRDCLNSESLSPDTHKALGAAIDAIGQMFGQS